MNWMFLILGAVAIGAVILAVYERRSRKTITAEHRYDPKRDPAQSAYLNAEMIRAEAGISNPPQAGGFF